MDERDPGQRLEEQETIDRLVDELLPALVAKLGSTGLGELEVHDGDWRVRLRRPLDAAAVSVEPSTDRAGHRRTSHTVGRAGARLTPVGPGLPADGDPASPEAEHADRPSPDPGPGGGRHRSIATSPAVGIFQGRTGISAGSRVIAGDPIGVIDVLGVSHEVTSPVDGIVGQALVTAGEPVEYGQEIAWIEQPDGLSRGSRDRSGGFETEGGD